MLAILSKMETEHKLKAAHMEELTVKTQQMNLTYERALQAQDLLQAAVAKMGQYFASILPNYFCKF